MSCIVSLQTLAADNVYTVFSVGYSDVEFIQDSNKSFGYKMAIGYQVDPQCYIEAGHQSLIRDKLYLTELPSATDVMHSENAQQGDALFSTERPKCRKVLLHRLSQRFLFWFGI